MSEQRAKYQTRLQPTEKSLHRQVVEYLKLQYPKVIFRTDFGAGIKMTIGQAVAQKSLQTGDKYPDLFIAEPNLRFHGLFIELKREGYKLLNKNNEYRTEHLKMQFRCMDKLISKGYMAAFAVGFDEAKQIIDKYMKYK